LWESECGEGWKSAESTPISLIFPYSQGFIHLEAFKEFMTSEYFIMASIRICTKENYGVREMGEDNAYS
jgi:hypothetical protein